MSYINDRGQTILVGDEAIKGFLEGIKRLREGGKGSGRHSTLYHGTTSDVLDKIKSQGLRPGMGGEIGEGSQKDAIYLSPDKDWAKNFASHKSKFTDGEPVVLEVLVPDQKIETDPEDPKGRIFRGSIPPANIKPLQENRKLHYRTEFQGLPISIENRRKSIRRGGEGDDAWETKMKHPYGYIKGTEGVDGDALDVFVGPDEHAAFAYIAHCQTPDGKEFDEDKVMLGFSSKEDAERCFHQHYDDPKFFGGIDEIPMWKFREKVWVKKHTTKKLVASMREAGTKGMKWGERKSKLPSDWKEVHHGTTVSGAKGILKSGLETGHSAEHEHLAEHAYVDTNRRRAIDYALQSSTKNGAIVTFRLPPDLAKKLKKDDDDPSETALIAKGGIPKEYIHSIEIVSPYQGKEQTWRLKNKSNEKDFGDVSGSYAHKSKKVYESFREGGVGSGRHKEEIEKGGGKLIGEDEDLVHFHDPKTNNSYALRPGDVSAENVAKKIDKGREEVAGKKKYDLHPVLRDMMKRKQYESREGGPGSGPQFKSGSRADAAQPSKNYGPEFDQAQASHELERYKAILRNPRANAATKKIAQQRIDEHATVMKREAKYKGFLEGGPGSGPHPVYHYTIGENLSGIASKGLVPRAGATTKGAGIVRKGNWNYVGANVDELHSRFAHYLSPHYDKKDTLQGATKLPYAVRLTIDGRKLNSERDPETPKKSEFYRTHDKISPDQIQKVELVKHDFGSTADQVVKSFTSLGSATKYVASELKNTKDKRGTKQKYSGMKIDWAAANSEESIDAMKGVKKPRSFYIKKHTKESLRESQYKTFLREAGKRFKLYYSRPMDRYGSESEANDLALISEAFPDADIVMPKTKRHAELGMGHFHKQINKTRRVIIKPTRKNRLTTGTWSEARHALKRKIPVYGIRNGRIREVKSVKVLNNPNQEGHFGRLVYKKEKK